MNNHLIPKSLDSHALINATDFSRFDIFLESLGLPKDNILAPIEERSVIQQNFPNFILTLDSQIKLESRYLSKFAAASAIGLFDAALNYIWNEVVLNLRKKVIIYGLELFYDAAVGGKYRELYSTEEDLSGIKDKVLLDKCEELELISNITYKKLTHILIMRNDIGASHPNDTTITAFELMSWLQTCVQNVIHDTPSAAALQVKALIENLKKQADIIDESNIAHIHSKLKELHNKNCDNILQTLFGIYVGSAGNTILKKNVSLIAPAVWSLSTDPLKYKLGIRLAGYHTNLHNDKFTLGNEFFEFCNGNQYKTLEAKIITIDEILSDLHSAHHSWDNFYHEVPIVKRLLTYIKSEADLPKECRGKLIRIITLCRIGKGISYNKGVSPSGKPLYDSLFSLFGDENIIQVLIQLYQNDTYNLLFNKYCRENAIDILIQLRKNAVSDKIKQILDFLLDPTKPTLEKNMQTSDFKKLASSHLLFP